MEKEGQVEKRLRQLNAHNLRRAVPLFVSLKKRHVKTHKENGKHMEGRDVCFFHPHTHPLHIHTHTHTNCTSDLNTILATWSNVACEGVLLFTTTSPATYTLDATFTMADDQDIIWDGSGSAGVTIVSPLNDRIINAYGIIGGSVMLKSLTFRGNGFVDEDGGCVRLEGVFPAIVEDAVFEQCKSNANIGQQDGGALFATGNPYVIG